jgi:hypothetical protein
MIQSSILELAKQGNSEAIATLINRSIQAKGITATAFLDHESLNIDLRSPQRINQKPMVSLIHKGMLNLQVKSIQDLIISAFQSDYETASDRQIWQVNLKLDSAQDLLVKDLPQAKSTPSLKLSASEPAPKPNLAETSTGILVYQPVQVKHIPQTYQDIIIRFTNSDYGNCLCTLSELIQMINSVNLDNPAFKNLQTAIAESTTIDDNGDRLITNISILQPGSQWQKAKIRIVVNIFFESKGYVPPAETNVAKISEVITLEAIETSAGSQENLELTTKSSDPDPILKPAKSQKDRSLEDEVLTLDELSKFLT